MASSATLFMCFDNKLCGYISGIKSFWNYSGSEFEKI